MDTRRDFIYIDDLVNVVMQAVVDGTGHGHYHVSTGSDYAIKELFDATIAALGITLDEDVEVRPRGEDDAYTILLDPSRVRADFGWDVTRPARGGRRAGDRVLPRVRDRGDLHAPAGGRMTRGSLAGARILVVGGAGFVGSNLVRALLAPRARADRRRRQPALERARERARGSRRRVRRGLDHRRRDARAAARAISTSSSSSPPTTATRARWSTRSPITSTTPSRRCACTRRSRT